MNRPQLSVVIPTHMRSESLARLLRSLEAQDLVRTAFEVVVISNLDDRAALFETEASAARGLPVSFHATGAVGVNKARNLGIERSKGEILFFLDDDCRLARRDHLRMLVARHEQEPRVPMRGGPYGSMTEAKWGAKAYNALVNAWIEGRHPEHLLLTGGNLSVVRSVIGETRFDESIVYGGSEISFQTGLKERGLESKYDVDLPVEHDVKGDLLGFAKKAWKQGRTKKEWGGGPAFRSLVALSRENPDTILFGICYGGVSRASWISSTLGRRFSLREK